MLHVCFILLWGQNRPWYPLWCDWWSTKQGSSLFPVFCVQLFSFLLGKTHVFFTTISLLDNINRSSRSLCFLQNYCQVITYKDSFMSIYQVMYQMYQHINHPIANIPGASFDKENELPILPSMISVISPLTILLSLITPQLQLSLSMNDYQSKFRLWVYKHFLVWNSEYSSVKGMCIGPFVCTGLYMCACACVCIGWKVIFPSNVYISVRKKFSSVVLYLTVWDREATHLVKLGD